jgi:tRNA (guanine-N7-)-methyltransferase
LIREGELLIVTDDRSYFEWIQTQTPGAGFDVNQEIISPRYFTKYERKWRESGQRLFFELRLIKSRHIEHDIKEETPLITYRVDHFDHEDFSPANGKGDILVDFKEFLYDPKRRKGMVRSVVAEDSLMQDFWMEIVELSDGWHIRPAKGCGILPTAGVQRALDLVHEAIEE